MVQRKADFPKRTVETLSKRAGGICSNPECNRYIYGPHTQCDKFINIGVAAHICAAEKGGKRFNPQMTIAQRKSIDNGIWLCQNCAKLIDSDSRIYTVKLLIQWKKEHENNIKKNISAGPMSHLKYLDKKFDKIFDALSTGNLQQDIYKKKENLLHYKDVFESVNIAIDSGDKESAHRILLESLSDAIISNAGQIVLTKIHTYLKICSDGKSKEIKKKAPILLPKLRREVLGIYSVSILPLDAEQLSDFFPDYNWKKEIQYFCRNGYMKRIEGMLDIEKNIKKIIQSDAEEVKIFHEAWINALEPYNHHIDVALLLAIHYLAIGRLEDTIEVLSNIVFGMEPSWWNKLYLQFFIKFEKVGLIRLLKPKSKSHFYNALGLSYAHENQYEKGIESFLKLRRHAKRINDNWAIGQSYINCGVAQFHLGNIDKAEKNYRAANQHSKNTGDFVLHGRALNNLAIIIYEKSPNEAFKMLKESLRIKESLGDQSGIVGSYMGFGNFYAYSEDFKTAIKWYRKAERKARKYDLLHQLSLILCNIGKAHIDLLMYKESLKYFTEANKIAESEGFNDSLVLSLRSKAGAYYFLGEYSEAEKLLRKLVILKKHLKEDNEFIGVLHDLGLLLLKQNEGKKARKILRRALAISRNKNDQEWIFRCRYTSANSYVDQRIVNRTLKIYAKSEYKAGMLIAAAKLWAEHANNLINTKEYSKEVEDSYTNSMECLDQEGKQIMLKLDILKHIYAWKLSINMLRPAIETLEEMENASKILKDNRQRIEALDEQGRCFQLLGIFEEAEKKHKKALLLAKKHKYKENAEISMNNLGELFRKTNRQQEAIRMFLASEKLARSRKDVDSELLVSLNRSLALESLGKDIEAELLLKNCRDKAKKNKLWDKQAEALHSLANLYWTQGKVRLAQNRYENAIRISGEKNLITIRNKIMISYGRFIKSKKNANLAIKLLEPIGIYYGFDIHSYDYYITMGDCYKAIHDLDKAKNSFEKALEYAHKNDRRDLVADCRVSIAEIYKKQKKNQLSIIELDKALENESDPEEKATILFNKFELLLSQNKNSQAERTWKNALDIVNEYGFKELNVNMHMTLGDHYWEYSTRKRYNALQAYMAGMACAIEVDIETFIEAGSHVIAKFNTIDGEYRITRIENLYSRIFEWLLKDQGATRGAANSVLWPLRAAKKLTLISKRWDKLSTKDFTNVIRAELTTLVKT